MIYTILKNRNDRTTETSGMLPELIQHFSYTLLVGNSWNKKVNMQPKTIKSFVTMINLATNSAAANGYSGTYFELKK